MWQGSKAYRAFHVGCHYATLKGFNGSTPKVLNGSSAEAWQFWHGVFQDFRELRELFPEYAHYFGPYTEPAPEVRIDNKAQIVARLAQMKAEREAEASGNTPGVAERL